MCSHIQAGSGISKEKVAYFVVHPESSGGRMMTEVLVRAGVWGQHTHRQEMDDMNFKDRPDRIVFRRSLPHSRIWPNLKAIIDGLIKEGYEVVPIVIIREKYPCARSQIQRSHVGSIEEAYDHMNHAAGLILWSLYPYTPVVISYERFVTSLDYRRQFGKAVGIDLPKDMVFFNANTKYCKSGS